MKNTKLSRFGFTLVELLVVVLIIGILAAVALPQYQRAVDKSRYATMIQTARSIESAQDVYFAENGKYASSIEDLAVSLPADLPRTHDGRLSIGPAGFHSGTDYTSAIYYEGNGNTRIAAYTLYHQFSTNGRKGSIYCFTYASRKERGDAICRSLGGELVQDNKSCGTTGSTICKEYKVITL